MNTVRGDVDNYPDRDLSRSFPSHPSSAAEVRGFVREGCSDALSERDLDAAVLLVTELVSNAMLHTETDHVDVRIEMRRGAIRIGVRDDEVGPPAPRAPTQEDTSGRGLQIVDRLAETWGVDYTESGGKCVWFSMSPCRACGSRP